VILTLRKTQIEHCDVVWLKLHRDYEANFIPLIVRIINWWIEQKISFYSERRNRAIIVQQAEERVFPWTWCFVALQFTAIRR